MSSESTEEYLEIIYKLQKEDAPVSTSQLAGVLGVSSAAVSEMVRRLADQGLLSLEPYRGVTLTAQGRKQAVEQVRHHRLWERFLTDVLGLKWDGVHDEACKLEHHLSDEVEERLAQALGHPVTCPHGHAIPTVSGEVHEEPATPLASLGPPQEALILRIADERADLLRYLASLGLMPQTTVQIEKKAPFQGPLMIRVGSAHYALGRDVAEQILVRPISSPNSRNGRNGLSGRNGPKAAETAQL